MNLIDQHQQLEASLNLAGLFQPSSEVHGMIVGSIANHMFTSKQPDLIRLLVGENADVKGQQPLQDLLNELYRETSGTLLENDDNFQLMLVESEAKLSVRTESLADWCRGYLLGLLQHETVSIDQLPEDGPEIARDILAISEAAPQEEASEEDEWALAELEEYVKVGTQLIFEFIVRLRSEQQEPAPLQ